MCLTEAFAVDITLTKLLNIVFILADRVENATQSSGVLVIRGTGDVPYKLEVPYESHVLRG